MPEGEKIANLSKNFLLIFHKLCTSISIESISNSISDNFIYINMPSVYGNRNFDMNRGAVFEDTTGVRPSRPLHVGGYSRTEERERLRSTYTTFHDRKLGYHDRRFQFHFIP